MKINIITCLLLFIANTTSFTQKIDPTPSYKQRVGLARILPRSTYLGIAEKKNWLLVNAFSLNATFMKENSSISIGIGHKTISGNVKMKTYEKSSSIRFALFIPYTKTSYKSVYHTAEEFDVNYKYLHIPFEARWYKDNFIFKGTRFYYGPTVTFDFAYDQNYDAKNINTSNFQQSRFAFQRLRREQLKSYLALRYTNGFLIERDRLSIHFGGSIPIIFNSVHHPIGRLKQAIEVSCDFAYKFSTH